MSSKIVKFTQTDVNRTCTFGSIENKPRVKSNKTTEEHTTILQSLSRFHIFRGLDKYYEVKNYVNIPKSGL